MLRVLEEFIIVNVCAWSEDDFRVTDTDWL